MSDLIGIGGPGRMSRAATWLHWRVSPALRWKRAQLRCTARLLESLSRYPGETFTVVELPTWHESLAPVLVCNADGEGLFRTDSSALGDLHCDGLINWPDVEDGDADAETFTLTNAGRRAVAS